MVTGLTRDETLVVLYDADCGICTQVSRALLRLDARRLLVLLPLQSAEVADAPPREELADSLHAVDAAGNWFRGARATVEIARRLPALWIVSAVAHLPGAMTILELGYRVVAANRRRLSDLLRLKACQVQPAGGRAR